TDEMHKPPLSCAASTHNQDPDTTHHNKPRMARQTGAKPAPVM
ncbi:hypothetical protein A2U01_0100168, partial [Trifolium medium]|nr:hypothetical protein [Trifolium medium]